MKTTMNLPDALFEALKQRAASEGRTVTSLMEEALRARLDAPHDGEREPLSLPSWDGRSADGYLIDIADKDALWDVLDERS